MCCSLQFLLHVIGCKFIPLAHNDLRQAPQPFLHLICASEMALSWARIHRSLATWSTQGLDLLTKKKCPVAADSTSKVRRACMVAARAGASAIGYASQLYVRLCYSSTWKLQLQDTNGATHDWAAWVQHGRIPHGCIQSSPWDQKEKLLSQHASNPSINYGYNQGWKSSTPDVPPIHPQCLNQVGNVQAPCLGTDFLQR
ncbi:hypothetical protein EDD16DRAFT_1523324 [Pisolithus croceorrhizus]|nr:hypothetical protein EV401DRAFT_1893244 [Pisolithus croceorrhizus]KAI6107268.1 hypothetical protein EDD16DRAFT_1523324 [Pisolithus croceorrhizus]KAI6167467.1 hypothetical protein EDD17DRAFT_1504579 [Pisolithus thermaeus]